MLQIIEVLRQNLATIRVGDAPLAGDESTQLVDFVSCDDPLTGYLGSSEINALLSGFFQLV